MAHVPDAAQPLTAAERWVLGLLVVPSAPEPPDGSPGSISVFHAGDNFYKWSLLEWGVRTVVFLLPLIAATLGIGTAMQRVPPWGQTTLTLLLVAMWMVCAVTALVTLLARRLNYLLRWYIVTDRSLRIRSGVFQVNELTMTYGNIQEIRVTAGPIQHVLGLADVEVQAAGGGGGDPRQRRDGHTGRFEGLSNADAIRDLIVDRLRQYRDTGLADAHHPGAGTTASEIAAATEVLEEARRLRAAVTRI